MPWWAVLVPVAYLVGTFPSAELVAGAAGVDIRRAGSGNPGASNITRTLGWRKGALVFALDALKGVLAAAVGLWLGGRAGGHALGIAAVIGHIFPISRRFRGGKGVASAGGMTFVLYPVVGLVAAAGWLAISRLTGKAAVASLTAVATVVVGTALTADRPWETLAMTAVAALLVVRHRSNLQRLWRGTESSL